MSTRREPGLFPATAAGRHAADRACAAGIFEPAAARPGHFVLSDRGREAVLADSPPRDLLEDIARAVESRRSQLEELIRATTTMRAEWLALSRLLADALASDPRTDAEWSAEVTAVLADWRAPGDCPLPELFARLRQKYDGLTIGQFHDRLRRLHESGAIYLHPWTGPLYTLPEPSFALLVGHEIAYYASRRSTAQAA